jgi:5-methylcytosine-specific restriction endonuclease McrA
MTTLYPTTKVCASCKQEKPLDQFKVYKGNPLSYCGDCTRDRDRARHNTDEHRAKRREQQAVKREARLREAQGKMPPPHKVRPISMFKVCPQCSVEKFLTEFALDSKRPDGHTPWCKGCASKKAHSRLDKRREYDHKRTPEEKQAREKTIRQWQRAHPLARQGYQLQRLARKKGASIIKKVNFARILERDGMHCYICDKPILSHHILTFDHRVPLVPQRDEPQGTHTEENIHPAHKECNSRKSNRQLENLTPFDRRGVDY